MNKDLTFAVVCGISAYVIGYAALYHFARPAANLAYWAYTEDTPEWVEKCTYYFFYPAYFVHQRVLGGSRHTWDRPKPHYPPGFAG